MNTKEKYKSAQDFRMAIQDKLLVKAKELDIDIQTLYRHTASSQFLARLFNGDQIDWALKGGYALELRLQESRTTKDVDLTLKDSKIFRTSIENQNKALHELLVEKSKIDLEDYFVFQVSAPIIDLVGTPCGGARFQVEAKIDGKIFSKLTLDIGIGDAWLESESLMLKNYLENAGLNPGAVKVIRLEQHTCEKIHAYSMPRDGFNSRVKDLVDLFLIFQMEKIDKDLFKKSLNETFKRRNTHTVPTLLDEPHEFWAERFERMIANFKNKTDINTAFKFVNKKYQSLIK